MTTKEEFTDHLTEKWAIAIMKKCGWMNTDPALTRIKLIEVKNAMKMYFFDLVHGREYSGE